MPQSRVKYSIDKSRMNATEKSDKFKLVLKEHKRNTLNQYNSPSSKERSTIYTTKATKISLRKFLN